MSLFKKPEEEIVAIFDIGNGSIGGALVKFSKHDLPVVLYLHREPITFIAQPSSKHLVSEMLKLLKSVAGHLAKDGLAHIKTSPFGGHKLRDAYCVFAAPWYISQTKVVKEVKDQSFAVTKESVNELVKKEQEQFNKELKEGKYEQIFGPDTRLLEKRVINMRLNGYDVEEPIGKSAKELELTLFTSFISQDILVRVEDVLHSSFSVRNIHHFSYALVSWSGSRIMFPDLHEYIFVDVSGETTDISLVIKDILVETISFPMGRSSLIRQAVADLEVEPDVALSFLKMYYAGTLDTGFEEKLKKMIAPTELLWREQFTTALSSFKKAYALPRATLVTADNDLVGFFLNALKQETPKELNIAQNSFAVTFLSPDKVQPFIYEFSEISHDAFIGIESIFLNEHFRKNN